MEKPIFGAFQKAQVSGDGFYSDFWMYAGKQPYPLIFVLTGIIIVLGIAFIIWGYKGKNNFQFAEVSVSGDLG